ncbi:cell envelope integrity protein TolA [Herminiimonas fonticola]|uniref:Cell division and transport-associated protein TolA n=1 Tax=Herminiimonas fonticola TaxID=303380 RepID=A0A4R6GK79_9BURK|nr:cell envelope integrity protein TolA [Herminiimonas fonticola]RBA25472.1 protein TolA [Herminiimonas fonticola]TDN94585.1 cell division and transport-associated protein TolA [Herminiimonas fonticola]
MTDNSPYTVPSEPGRWRAITLAVAVHVALLVFFWIGIDWQNQTPVAIKAEIWDMQAKEAAPLPPEPEPTPQPKPEPKPVVKEEPKAEPIKPEPPKVDIALEKEKKRKEQERKDKLAAEEKEKKLKQKAEQEKQDKLDKQLADKKAEQQKKADADKKRLQDQRDAELSDKRRAEELRRLTGAIGSGGSGQAAKSQGSGRADGAYADKIRAKIRSNTVFNVPPELSGNPQVEYDVELLPDGSLRGLHLRKSSGLPGFDEAVKRAIERSQPFPPDQSGSVPGRLTIVHKPKDQ